MASKLSPSKVPGPKAGPNGSFPVGDDKHARLAIGGATRSERAGNISPAEEAKIKAEARKKLDKGKPKKNAQAAPSDFGAGRRSFGQKSWGQFGQGQPAPQAPGAPGGDDDDGDMGGDE